MLYLMRHGKTEWNQKHKLQGRTDIPLCEEGRIMAENAGKEYGDVHFDLCYCSPLIRAQETAQLMLQGRDVPVITDNRLTEMGFGVYEGIENCFLIPDCPVNVLFQAPEQYTVPVEGGESFEELFARTGSFLREIIYPQLEQNKDILVMGHGAMNASIICQVKHLPLQEFWTFKLGNCKLIRV